MKDEAKIVERLHELKAVMDKLQAKANKELQKRDRTWTYFCSAF